VADEVQELAGEILMDEKESHAGTRDLDENEGGGTGSGR
jgi:hypothetical protein